MHSNLALAVPTTSRGLPRSFGTKGQFDACSGSPGAIVMLTTSSARKARNRVDISSKELARHWCKRLKKSKDEIEAAIAKVGDNAETVIKELGVQER
jgi:hypothetical protein